MTDRVRLKDPREGRLTEAFTLVFAGDIRKFTKNVFKTETPYGIPYAVSMGDALEELDDARAALKEQSNG